MRASLLSRAGAYQSLPTVGILDLPVSLVKRELHGSAASASTRAASSDSDLQGKHAPEILHYDGKAAPVPALSDWSELPGGSTYRMALNNWLQLHGGVDRLSWDVAPTGPQNDVTWTAFARSKTRLHQRFVANTTFL
jgi:hypothetical protein